MQLQKITILLILLLCSMGVLNAANKTVVFAHRGGAALAPENTLAAISNAIELKSDYFEIDVQVSLDDSLMIIHDATIDRTTNGSGSVNAMSYLQLRQYDAGSWFGPEFTGEKIPTLAEVLDLALTDPNEIGVIIEIKASTPTIVQKVIDKVHERNMEDRVIISSFSLGQITDSKLIDSAIPVQLFATINQTHINNVDAIGGEWVGTGGTVTDALVDSVHAKGMYLNKWTVNNPAQMLTLIDMDVDALTTDNPAVAIALMDTTPPSDVVLNDAQVNITKIMLSWEAATDEECGINGYEIYRDISPDVTTLLTTVADTTVYIDETLQEETTFYYRIKAINGNGVTSKNYSNEVSAKTEIDNVPPKVEAIFSFGLDDKIVVKFDERVDKISAETFANYTIDNDITINSVTLAFDSFSVIMNTSTLSEGTDYTLSISGIIDLAKTPNVMTDPEHIVFQHNKLLSQTIAAYDFDEGEGAILTDITGNGNIGTVMNDVTWSGGYMGNGLTFDGVDDYVIITSSTLDVSGDAVSLSAWINLSYLPGELPYSYGPIFDSDIDNYILYEDRGNNELRFKVATEVRSERPGIPAVDLKKNEWINVTGVYDGASVKIYLNAKLKDTHDLTGNIQTGQRITLGHTPGSLFEGCMDNIYVFDRALTEEEIKYLYSGENYPTTITEKENLPEEFSLSQNYPNPFNPSTTISFELSKTGYISIDIYSIDGRLVQNIYNGKKSLGFHEIKFNAVGFTSGVYFYRLTVGGISSVKKMVLIR